jgi:hypothetical protein
MWLFLESRAQAVFVLCFLMIWTISLFAQSLTLMLFKFSRRCAFQTATNSPIFRDDGDSSIAFIDPSDPTLSEEFRCRDGDFEAPDDIRCIPSLDHDPLETFDPDAAEVSLNVQILSRILEEQ